MYLNNRDFAGTPSFVIKVEDPEFGECYTIYPWNAEAGEAFGEWVKYNEERQQRKCGAV